MSKRIVYIDIAKALCIILVVIGHYNPEGSPVWWIYIHDFIYTFHMPLFMFASGFVYMATKKETQRYGDFLRKKAKRLMIPYLVVSTIVISIKLLTEGHVYVEHPKNVMSFVKMLYYPEAGFFLWFIWALWWMFVIIPLFRTKKYRLILLFASLLLHYIPFAITDIFCINQQKNMMIYFVLGVVAYDWKTMFAKLEKIIPSMVYVITFLIIASYYLAKGRGGVFIPYLGITATVALGQIIEKSNFKKDWLMIISASSYIIYLFHTTFEGFAKAVVLKFPYFRETDNDYMFAIGAMFVVTCGVVGPIVLHEKVLKRFMLTKVLFGIK